MEYKPGCCWLEIPLTETGSFHCKGDFNRMDISPPMNLAKSDADDRFSNSESYSVTSGDRELLISDSESGISGSYSGLNEWSNEGFSRVDDKLRELIERRFMMGLGSLERESSIVEIYRNCFSSFVSKARLDSFQIHLRATEKKNGGNANVKYAWFGASKEEIRKIVLHGFSSGHCRRPENSGFHGGGIYLSPDHSPLESIENSDTDENGIHHLLLCRVILGNLEVVPAGSHQSNPGSGEFDSGVDNLSAPTKFIIWSSHMNSHILPAFLITFRAPLKNSTVKIQEPKKRPSSPWMPFPSVISALSKSLPTVKILTIAKHYKDHKQNKIPRHELIRNVRKIAGDELLIQVIKSSRREDNVGLKLNGGISNGRTNLIRIFNLTFLSHESNVNRRNRIRKSSTGRD